MSRRIYVPANVRRQLTERRPPRTVPEIRDCIEFALTRLDSIRADVLKIERSQIDPIDPEWPPDAGAAFALGRAQAIAFSLISQIEFLRSELAACIPPPAGKFPDAKQFAVTAGKMPAGLTLDPRTGTISGVPTEAGSFSIDIAPEETNPNDGPHEPAAKEPPLSPEEIEIAVENHIRKSEIVCPCRRLNEDGICRACGADRRRG